MKKACLILVLAAAAACTEKEELCRTPEEIILRTGEACAFETKAMSEVTSLSSFNLLTTSATGGTVTSNKSVSVSSGSVSTGCYWPASGALSFFGVYPAASMTNSSGTISFPVGSSSSKLNGTEDYVFASSRGVANGTRPVQLTFSHILSNITAFSFSTPNGVSHSISSISISIPRYGRYVSSAASDSWDSLGSRESVSLSQSPDYSVIPGTYTITVSYSVTCGGVSQNWTKSGNVTLPAGKRCTISSSLTNTLAPLTLSVTVTDWTTGSTWTENFSR